MNIIEIISVLPISYKKSEEITSKRWAFKTRKKYSSSAMAVRQQLILEASFANSFWRLSRMLFI